MATMVALARTEKTLSRLGSISPLVNDLGCCKSSDGVEQLILYGFKEFLSHRVLRVIVSAESVDILDLLIEPLFGRPDGTYAIQKLIKVVKVSRFAQALVI